MRRIISVAAGLWILAGLPAMAQMSPEAAVGQALPPGIMMAQGSGPMTWGGVLSRTLMPAPPPGSAGVELVEAPSPDPAPDAAQGELLVQAPVVELFTSQGCAACPPADAFFGMLSARKDIIALALHVDYWDYIGWADDFARSDYTKRQKAYARVAGSKVIYTPQAVVEGQEALPGNDVTRISTLLASGIGASPVVPLRLVQEGERRIVTAAPVPGQGELMVQLVRYVPERTVTIERGENAGRTVTYHNIVTDWALLGLWDGQDPLRLELTLTGEAPAVILLQRGGHGPIIAAARLP